jgi:hypothetical protein
MTIEVSYSPAAMGPSTAYLPYTGCAGCVEQSVSLTGVGVDCQLTLSPSPVSFSGVPAGTTTIQTLTVTDTGTEACTVTSLGTFSGSSVFTLSGYPTLPTSLTPQQSFNAQVAYTATGALGGDSDEILAVFTVADPAVPARTAQDPLYGNQSLPPCTLGISPTSANFGDVAANSVGTQHVTLANSGSTACQVSGIALGPTTDPTFALGPGQATALSVQPGSSQQITVTFTPTSTTAPLTRLGELTFQTGDTANPSATVPLSGNIG